MTEVQISEFSAGGSIVAGRTRHTDVSGKRQAVLPESGDSGLCSPPGRDGVCLRLSSRLRSTLGSGAEKAAGGHLGAELAGPAAGRAAALGRVWWGLRNGLHEARADASPGDASSALSPARKDKQRGVGI